MVGVVARIALPGPSTPLADATLAALARRGHVAVDDPSSADAVVDLGEWGADGTKATLAALDAVPGEARYVLVSSATVYGAWAANPVPLPESAPLRPNPAFAPAVDKAECERLVAEWASAAPTRKVTVLRPAVTAGRRPLDPMARALVGGGARPVQVVSEDDVAEAVALVVDRDLDGTFNVAPDGAIPADTVDELAGAAPEVAPLDRVREVLRRLRRAAWPGVEAYTQHPWVVANDRLRAAGWSPSSTNEEALVVASPPSKWRDLSPKRRQELALAAAGLGLAGVVAGSVLGIRALLRRRSG